MVNRKIVRPIAHHSNEYVQSRINDYEMEDLNKETESRIIFEEIEKHFKTDFIEGRIFDYDLKIKNEGCNKTTIGDCETTLMIMSKKNSQL